MSALEGEQTPRYMWVPPHLSSAGQEAVSFAALAGLYLDPWQQLVLDGALAENSDHRWTCFEVCLIVSRQNGKGSILEALELASLFLFGDKLIIHSAHQFNTSAEHFARIAQLIESTPDLDRQVQKISNAHGREGVELKNGSRLKFMARTGSSGRGFSGDKVIFDEAMYLDALQMQAMLPTLSTRKNAQVWYTGSAGFKTSDHLAKVRRRGIRGAEGRMGDPSLAYFEWSIDERPVAEGGDRRDDPASWGKANPSMGIRIPVEYIKKECAAFGGPDSAAFGMERLGVGDWPDEDEAWAVVDRQPWEDCINNESQIMDVLAFGIDSDSAAQIGCIGVVGRNQDGKIHYEIAHRQPGVAWMADWLIERVPVWQPQAVCVIPTSPAGSTIARLEAAGIEVTRVTSTDYARSCGAFYTDVMETASAVHLDQPSLTRSLGGARKKDLAEGGWIWSRKDTILDLAPVVAVTLARHGYAEPSKNLEPLMSLGNSLNQQQPMNRPEPYLAGSAALSAAREGRELEPFVGYIEDAIQQPDDTYSNAGSTGFAAIKRGIT